MQQGAVNFDQNAASGSVADQKPTTYVAATPASGATWPETKLAGSTEPVAAQANPAPTEPPPAEIHTMNLTLLVTLGLGDERMHDLKTLKSVPVENKGISQTYNLYNPFMRQKGDGEGIVRATLRSILRLADRLAGSNVVYLGDEGSAYDTVCNVARSIAAGCNRLIPIPQTEELLEITETVDGVPQDPTVLTFGDVFRVKAWAVQGHGELPGVVTNNVYLNLMCNAGAAYDSEEPHAFILKVASLVTNLINAMQAADEGILGNLDVFMGVGLDSTSLVQDRMQEVLSLLTAEHGFGIVSLAHVLAGKEDWIDQDQADCLFDRNCDMLLLRNLLEEEAEEEEAVEEEVEEEEIADDEVDEDED